MSDLHKLIERLEDADLTNECEHHPRDKCWGGCCKCVFYSDYNRAVVIQGLRKLAVMEERTAERKGVAECH